MPQADFRIRAKCWGSRDELAFGVSRTKNFCILIDLTHSKETEADPSETVEIMKYLTYKKQGKL